MENGEWRVEYREWGRALRGLAGIAVDGWGKSKSRPGNGAGRLGGVKWGTFYARFWIGGGVGDRPADHNLGGAFSQF